MGPFWRRQDRDPCGLRRVLRFNAIRHVRAEYLPNPPFVQSVNYANASFSNVAAGTLGTITSPLTLHATQLPAHIPYSQQWNFSIQRQLPREAVLQVAYVGSKGTHLLGIVDINEAYPGTALAAGLHTVTSAAPTIFTTADAPRINAV